MSGDEPLHVEMKAFLQKPPTKVEDWIKEVCLFTAFSEVCAALSCEIEAQGVQMVLTPKQHSNSHIYVCRMLHETRGVDWDEAEDDQNPETNRSMTSRRSHQGGGRQKCHVCPLRSESFCRCLDIKFVDTLMHQDYERIESVR